MKKVLVAILFVLLVAPTVAKWQVMANYFNNYEHYAYELCINQDQKEFECNGQCALMQDMQLVEQQNDQGKEQSNVTMGFEFEPMLLSFFPVSSGILLSEYKVFTKYRNTYRYTQIDKIYHPPVLA